MKTDVQKALDYLQSITIECPHMCHDITGADSCPSCVTSCTRKYPVLQASQFMVGPMSIERVDLGALLMSLSKWGWGYEMDSFIDVNNEGIAEYCAVISQYCAYTTTSTCRMVGHPCGISFGQKSPTDAVLIALAEAEGYEF